VSDIYSALTTGAPGAGLPRQQPVVVFVVGQLGVDTAAVTAARREQLAATVIDMDHSPGAFQPLRDAGAHAIVHTTMRRPEQLAEQAAAFRAAGYRVEAAIVAAPEASSRLGIVNSYGAEVAQHGNGRWTSREDHDASYRNVQDLAVTIDQDRIVDVATVYDQNAKQLSINYLHADRQWHWPASTEVAVAAERGRPWNPEETRQFVGSVNDKLQQMPYLQEELYDVTARAGSVRHPTVGPPSFAPNLDQDKTPVDLSALDPYRQHLPVDLSALDPQQSKQSPVGQAFPGTTRAALSSSTGPVQQVGMPAAVRQVGPLMRGDAAGR
jgi:hypothetical protein